MRSTIPAPFGPDTSDDARGATLTGALAAMMKAPIDRMHSELDYYAAQLAGAPVEAPIPDNRAREHDECAASCRWYGDDTSQDLIDGQDYVSHCEKSDRLR